MMDLQLLRKKILIGLISHNRLNFTKKALETLVKTGVPFDLLIVDNGSEPEAKKELFKLSQDFGAHMISIENRNCNGARDMINHYGLQYDYVVYVDNDVIMPENWLEKLLGSALETGAALTGVAQADQGEKDSFFGDFTVEPPFISFMDNKDEIRKPTPVDWVSGHCLMVEGDFLRSIWLKYNLWERRFLFPIDLDDIDLMMMVKKENRNTYVAPLVIPQNRDMDSKRESHNYNADRNDFHNYALSCVSFWKEWGLNPLLNWNKGYTGNINKPGRIQDEKLRAEFIELVEMIRSKDEDIYTSFREKLETQ